MIGIIDGKTNPSVRSVSGRELFWAPFPSKRGHTS
jgi:hypothetical protein